jgi:hypothetical protein
MRVLRHLRIWAPPLLAAALIALFGCRAFEPETVIVNHAPETYVTGGPQGGAGGRFHHHLFWYGTDSDGRVVRYVWALTDGTVQNPATDDDEEDIRFNPAENITTLQIGHYTTRTDSIFDFQINEGSTTSADMTFHIVAIDDRGDFDRTPARLYFLSNALGQPAIQFYLGDEQTVASRFADFDTIGFALPFRLTWQGTTPNTRGYAPALLAARDTVPPLDGLFGFKYRMPLDVVCDATSEDCWNPRRFDPATNRLVSYFSNVNSLDFSNDASGEDVSRRLLTQGVHTVLVNAIDVAGVEIQADNQDLNFVHNYDPETMILGHVKPIDLDHDGTIEPGEELSYVRDPFYPGDANDYPYFEVYRPDGTVSTTTFTEGTRVPQRAVVHFKAIGWDDYRDTRLRDIPGQTPPGYGLRFQGKFDAVGRFLGGENSLFRFATQYSGLQNSVWDDFNNTAIGSSDTVSFVVGSFDYRVSMRALDEHERRDGTPDVFAFFGNFRPEVQCVEVVTNGALSGYPEDDCSDELKTYYCATNTTPDYPDPTWTRLQQIYFVPRTIYFNPATNAVWYEEPADITGLASVQGYFYQYDLLLYAEDQQDERLFLPRRSPTDLMTYGNAIDRAMSWRYKIVSHRDSLANVIREGGGSDDLSQVSYTFNANFSNNYDSNGVWRLRVDVFVPLYLLSLGDVGYRGILASQNPTWTPDTLDRAIDLTTRQLGLNTARVVVRDASSSIYRPDRCAYAYYSGLRVPTPHNEGCDVIPGDGVAARLRFNDFCLESETFTKQYLIKAYTQLLGVYPTGY